jgi:transcriptional regulator with XRE-family HTH domain
MSQGYTIKVAEAIRNADGSLIGVQLGHICLKRGISVIEAARIFGVTRQTVYQWFCGETLPHERHNDAIRDWVEQLNQTTES